MSGKRDWLFRIEDMISSIEELENHLKAVSEETFHNDTFIQKATERYFEIIGEAARFVPKDIQKKYTDVVWSDIIGMRHKISHDYLDIDTGVLWNSYKNDFEELKNQLIILLKKEGS